MTCRHVIMFIAFVSVAVLFIMTAAEVQGEDESSNELLMPTQLYLAGSDEPLTLWGEAPDENAGGESQSATVSESPGADYVEVGTWHSNELDKDLHIDGDIEIVFWINCTVNDGPTLRFRITLFGQIFESEDWYGTSQGTQQVLIQQQMTADIARDDTISLTIEADARDSTEFPPPPDKEIHLHYWHVDFPSRISFPSNATDIDMDMVIARDDGDVRYYEIYLNITDAFTDRHIDQSSFIFNITSIDEPENFTAEDRRDGNESDYIEYKGAWYGGDVRYLIAQYNWYFEGRDYYEGNEGQGVQPGDFNVRFDMKDVEDNDRWYYHVEKGVSPIYVSMNIHTHPDYITIVDDRDKTVTEVAENDDVRIRVYIYMNQGKPDYTYQFAIEVRDNGVLVDMGRQVIQMEGKTGLNLFFDWTPKEGNREISVEVDSDNEWDEIDENDNDVSRIIDVIGEARPTVIISHPAEGSWENEDMKVLYDASNSTNPLSGDMTFSWYIMQWDGEDYVAKESLNGERVRTNKKYSPGKYKAELTVENDKRRVTEESIFFINAVPDIGVISPDEDLVYNTGEQILFDARDSSDDDGDTLYYYWFSDISGVLNRQDTYTGPTDYTKDWFQRTMTGGVHRITLEVTDYDPTDPPDNGKHGTGIYLFDLTVNTAPNVEIITPSDGSSYSAETPIEFDASRTEDADGDFLTFDWSDGQQFLSSEAKFNDTLKAGSHEIRLEVSDGKSTVVVTMTINVGSPPVALTSDSKTGEFKNGKGKVKLDASGSTPAADTLPIVKYIWDRDAEVDSDEDGIPDNDADVQKEDPTVELVYESKGTFTAVLVVEDSAGVRSQPFYITIKIQEEDEEDTPIALIGGAAAAVAVAVILILVFMFRGGDEEDDEDEYEDEYYGEAEYEEGEYEAEYY